MLLAPTLALLLSGASLSAPVDAGQGDIVRVAVVDPEAADKPASVKSIKVEAEPVAPETAEAATKKVEALIVEEAQKKPSAPTALEPIAPKPLQAEPQQPEPLQPEKPAVFAGETDEAVVQKIIDHLQSVDTLTADFEQAAPSGSVSQGKLWLRRPRQLRMQYGAADGAADDAPLLIVASQGFVYVRDNALETTDSYPVKKTPLRFLLSKKVALEDLDVRAVYRSADSVSVTFADPQGDTEGDLTAVFDAPGLALKQWIVRDPQQGLTIVTLSNRQSGTRLANRLFRTPEAGGQFINN